MHPVNHVSNYLFFNYYYQYYDYSARDKIYGLNMVGMKRFFLDNKFSKIISVINESVINGCILFSVDDR